MSAFTSEHSEHGGRASTDGLDINWALASPQDVLLALADRLAYLAANLPSDNPDKQTCATAVLYVNSATCSLDGIACENGEPTSDEMVAV